MNPYGIIYRLVAALGWEVVEEFENGMNYWGINDYGLSAKESWSAFSTLQLTTVLYVGDWDYFLASLT
jgi:hypothetical protein